MYISLMHITKQPSDETVKLEMQMIIRNTMKHKNRRIHIKLCTHTWCP